MYIHDCGEQTRTSSQFAREGSKAHYYRDGRSRALDRIRRHFCTLEEKLPAEMRAPFTESLVIEKERKKEGGNVTDRTYNLRTFLFVYSDNYRVTRRWDCAWRLGAGGRDGPCSWSGTRDAEPYVPRGDDFCVGNHRRKSRCRQFHLLRHPRQRYYRCHFRCRYRMFRSRCCRTIWKIRR